MCSQTAKNWIDLGEWGKEMDGFKLPSSNELSGKELNLRFKDNNRIVKYVFHDAGHITSGTGVSLGKKPVEAETYEAICVAPGIYFVDFVKKAEDTISNSLVLDFSTRKATLVTAIIPPLRKTDFNFVSRLEKGVDLSMVKVEIRHAIIDPASDDEPVAVHERTSDLIGKRIQYTYSRNRIYEHIYLNDRFYTWHCLVGPEAGLGDTEFCDYFKIAKDIYLFSWREKIMPTFGLVLIDLKSMRSNGKTFGLDIATGEYLNFTMGALAKFLNETKYK